MARQKVPILGEMQQQGFNMIDLGFPTVCFEIYRRNNLFFTLKYVIHLLLFETIKTIYLPELG